LPKKSAFHRKILTFTIYKSSHYTSKSNEFTLQKRCFYHAKGLLLHCKSNAFCKWMQCIQETLVMRSFIL